MIREVVFVKRDTFLEEVCEILDRHVISGVPVIGDDQSVAGVISEKDFLVHMGAKEKRSFMGVVGHCLRSKESWSRGPDFGLPLEGAWLPKPTSVK